MMSKISSTWRNNRIVWLNPSALLRFFGAVTAVWIIQASCSWNVCSEVALSPQDLLTDSEYVVTGVLREQRVLASLGSERQWSDSSINRFVLGKIEVLEVFKGDPSTKEIYLFRVRNRLRSEPESWNVIGDIGDTLLLYGQDLRKHNDLEIMASAIIANFNGACEELLNGTFKGERWNTFVLDSVLLARVAVSAEVKATISNLRGMSGAIWLGCPRDDFVASAMFRGGSICIDGEPGWPDIEYSRSEYLEELRLRNSRVVD